MKFTNNQRVVAYGVSEVAEFFVVFPGRRGRPRRNLKFWTFQKKAKRDGNFLFPFFKTVHQKGLLGRIK